MTDRVARLLFFLAASLVAVTAVSTAAWALVTVFSRPLDGVEGDVLFEAHRIRQGLALYTDPAVGVADYGPPKARYLVLYPPLWSALLAAVPVVWQEIAGRFVAMAAWFGVLVWIACKTPLVPGFAPRPTPSGFSASRKFPDAFAGAPLDRRALVALGAAFVGGTWLFGLYGASARPDALAVCLSGVALERASRRGRLDFASGALFALAAWVKPNVVGAAPGAFVGCFLAAVHASRSTGRGVRAARAIAGGFAGALVISAAAAGLLSAIAGRAWIEHLLASTGQPPSLALFQAQLQSRLPFFAAPLASAIVLGLRSRRDAGVAIATGAVVSSTLWGVLCLAKIGSAANYFMEPSVAALVVLARAPLPVLELRSVRIAVVAGCFAQILHNGVASVRSAIEGTTSAFARARVLATVRETCAMAPDDVVLADEPGLELMLDDRIVQTPFQSTHLARRGRFPISAWISDVNDPRAACLVMQDDLLERPLGSVTIEHDRFGPELRAALSARFELVETRSGYLIYRPKR